MKRIDAMKGLPLAVRYCEQNPGLSTHLYHLWKVLRATEKHGDSGFRNLCLTSFHASSAVFTQTKSTFVCYLNPTVVGYLNQNLWNFKLSVCANLRDPRDNNTF